VRRRPVAQRLEQEAESVVRLLGVDPDHPEELLLELRVGDADRATADLLAVPDDVVGERPCLAGLLGVELAFRSRERVMERIPAALPLVPLEQRPVDDPAKALRALVDQLESLGEVEAQLRQHGVRHRRLVGDDQEQVALLRAEAFVQRRELL
jgi:hypothetical protein